MRCGPTVTAPEAALNAWLDDWARLVEARRHYANDLRTLGVPRPVRRAGGGRHPNRRRQDERLGPRAGHTHRLVQHRPAPGRGRRRHPASTARKATSDRRLDGKVALITGAGSGMGRRRGRAVRERGRARRRDRRRRARGDDAVAAIAAAGGDATFVRANVAEWDDCEAMVASAIEHLRRAARALQQRRHLPRRRRRRARDARGDVGTGDGGQPRRACGSAARPGSPRCSSRAAARSSTSRRSSRSMGAATAQIAYTASKGGVLSMTREIAVEYARQGIRANSLCPGPIADAAARGAAVRSRPPRAPDGAHPDGPARARRGARQGGAVPRVRRRVVHDRRARSSSTAASPPRTSRPSSGVSPTMPA